MGNPVEQQQSVYYDTEKGQYYTVKPPESNQFNPFGTYGRMNPIYLNNPSNRNYLGNPYSSKNLDRFTTNAQATPYAELTNLFPSLNASLMQNSPTSLLAPTDTQSSGAGRFLAPSNTSQGE